MKFPPAPKFTLTGFIRQADDGGVRSTSANLVLGLWRHFSSAPHVFAAERGSSGASIDLWIVRDLAAY